MPKKLKGGLVVRKKNECLINDGKLFPMRQNEQIEPCVNNKDIDTILAYLSILTTNNQNVNNTTQQIIDGLQSFEENSYNEFITKLNILYITYQSENRNLEQIISELNSPLVQNGGGPIFPEVNMKHFLISNLLLLLLFLVIYRKLNKFYIEWCAASPDLLLGTLSTMFRDYFVRSKTNTYYCNQINQVNQNFENFIKFFLENFPIVIFTMFTGYVGMIASALQSKEKPEGEEGEEAQTDNEIEFKNFVAKTLRANFAILEKGFYIYRAIFYLIAVSVAIAETGGISLIKSLEIVYTSNFGQRLTKDLKEEDTSLSESNKISDSQDDLGNQIVKKYTLRSRQIGGKLKKKVTLRTPKSKVLRKKK